MADPTPASPPSPTAPLPPSRAAVQVAIAWGIGLAVLLGTGRLAVLGGFAADVSSTLTAAYFLLVPVVLARRQGLEPADFLGLHGRRAGRALLAFLLVAAVVFPPYVAAFAGWSRFVEDRPMRLPSRPWTDYPSEVRGRPDLAGIGPSVVAWTQEDVLYVLNASPDPVQATVRGCEGTVSGLSRRDGRVFLRESDGVPAPDGTIAGSLAPDTGWRCRLAGPFLAALDGPHAPWRTGESLRAPGGDAVDADRSLGWILELVLVHLLVIALPEETFYRGFVQARLAPLFRRRVRILGADVGGHVVIASALFALSHLVAIPAPFRLAVFFPGLLFGWLRERTGSLVAPIVLHCASNVLLAVLVRFQGV